MTQLVLEQALNGLQFGLMLFLPFLVIDLVVASTLYSLPFAVQPNLPVAPQTRPINAFALCCPLIQKLRRLRRQLHLHVIHNTFPILDINTFEIIHMEK